jgi:uracil-DNA glycosylase|tara:strand:- start:453 stop:1175 length:723 start_codon:yes stop_codon:yes gene_type:complete
MMNQRVNLHASWQALLKDQFELTYMQSLRQFLLEEKRLGKQIYPPGNRIFAALDAVPVDKVRVVIIGQDPYHGPAQAHGLSFSVPNGMSIPPSLRNVLKEIDADVGLAEPLQANCGDLSSWAEQGVLLLNSVLTVEQAQAASHQGKGWEQFTDVLVSRLAAQRQGLVFLLWGAYAQKKGKLVDAQRHHLLLAPHPSPLSAHRGFLGCKHFSQTNKILAAQGLPIIDWSQSNVPGETANNE